MPRSKRLLIGYWIATALFCLQAPPEEVRQCPQPAAARGPTPGLRAVAHRQVSDQRQAEVEREAGVSPLLEAAQVPAPAAPRCRAAWPPTAAPGSRLGSRGA